MIKQLIIALCLIIGSNSTAIAPVVNAEGGISNKKTLPRLFVRITAYTPKSKFEPKINHRGKSIRNEDGVAVPKGLLPQGTIIYIKGIGNRVVDDRIPSKSARKFGGDVVDVRWYWEIEKGKSIKKQLQRLDRGWQEIIVVKYPKR